MMNNIDDKGETLHMKNLYSLFYPRHTGIVGMIITVH